MQNKPSYVVVPLSHPLGMGQRDSSNQIWDSIGAKAGTVSLKRLAQKVLSRDNARDKHAWQERFEERAAILEFDGGMSRAEAEEKARQELKL